MAGRGMCHRGNEKTDPGLFFLSASVSPWPISFLLLPDFFRLGIENGGCDKEVKIRHLLLRVMILEHPPEEGDIPKTRNFLFPRRRSRHAQPADDQRAAVVDGDGGFG